jgi:hypothetical protein
MCISPWAIEFLNKHRCDCGDKKELKVTNESSYWIWDLESFTEPVILREGNEIDKPTSLSEHRGSRASQ